MWKVEAVVKVPKLNNPILIEGLPGIGNVGKVAVDFLIEELKAVRLYDFSSYTLPNSVFVNEKNTVELPKIEMYYKKFKNKKHDLLFLAGDVQPIDEVSCFEFCDTVLDLLQEFGGKDVITTGGIGLQAIPEDPKVYVTGTTQAAVKDYKKGIKVEPSLYGVVGPIVGVSGILLGLADKRKGMRGVAFLAETFGHPMYLGLKGAKAITARLKIKLNIKVDLKRMEKEIEELEKEAMKKTKQLSQSSSKSRALKKIRDKFGSETSYIG